MAGATGLPALLTSFRLLSAIRLVDEARTIGFPGPKFLPGRDIAPQV